MSRPIARSDIGMRVGLQAVDCTMPLQRDKEAR